MAQSLASESPRPLVARLSRAPVPFDAAFADDVLGRLDGRLGDGALGEVMRGTAGSSPYLGQLALKHGDWLTGVAERAPEEAMAAILDDMAGAIDARPDQKGAARALRIAKSRAALLIALADLGGAWDLDAVTGALSDLADATLGAAVKWLLREELRRKKLPGLTEEGAETGAAFVVLAMGKQGARELNYSSDIDLICLFDESLHEEDDLLEAKSRYIHVTRGLVRLIADQTEDGYVFRTDLRLRPAPSTTPVCLAMEAAERYYESVGRTWERAAHIKARPAAGNLEAGRAYLERLTPFVWRRYLDFAAIEDTHEMLRKIRAKKGKFTPEGLPGHDMKLGPGGIREIEFFAQTRQLISGGREPRLREPTTVGALDALVAVGQVPRGTADMLAADYRAHRETEHRLQMVSDTQTQAIPKTEEGRARVAALAGWSDVGDWERDVADRLARVHATCEAFFKPAPEEESEDAARAAQPSTGDALEAAGFERPEDARRLLERWRSGTLPATRSARARALYQQLEPRILRKLGRAANPDEAIMEVDRFLSGLPAGVQVFSLFRANPHLLDLIMEICAVAPRLAGHLGRKPQTLDALLSREFFEPMPGKTQLVADLERWLEGVKDYERALDTVRRWAREQRFRAGVQVLRGLADADEAGAAHSAIAEACLVSLMPRVIADFASRHGPPPGEGMAVVALGKLGSREMTGGSDLDLITVYDADGQTQSEGPRPLAVGQYYPRLTQALVAALTAPTAEGRLYEVDMRLRPSGRQGPVATSLASFRGYQTEKAWVWEHMAMTRARVVAGPGSVAGAVRQTLDEALGARAGTDEVLVSACEMRAKLIEAHSADRGDPWNVKHAAGGLMEIEFLAQTGILHQGLRGWRSAGAALPELGRRGWIAAEEAETLAGALTLMQRLQQLERVALEKPFRPEEAGRGLRRAMAREGGFERFAELEADLVARQEAAAAIVARFFDAVDCDP